MVAGMSPRKTISLNRFTYHGYELSRMIRKATPARKRVSMQKKTRRNRDDMNVILLDQAF